MSDDGRSATEDLMQVFCGDCHRETSHEVKARYQWFWESDDRFFWLDNRYLITQFRGCNHVSFLHESLFSEDAPFGPDEEAEYGRKIYPPPSARPLPTWIDEVPRELSEILSEAYSALQAGSCRLAAMGARATLEYLMLSKIDDQGSFKNNVDEFISKGHLQPALKKTLISSLDVGSAAIHRGYKPDIEVLSELFDIIEGLMESTILFPKKAALIEKSVPARKPHGRERT